MNASLKTRKNVVMFFTYLVLILGSISMIFPFVWMLLSAALPADAELESVIPSACFQVVRRGGFTHPRGKNAELLKKQTQYFLSNGSIIAQPFSGDLFDVGFSPDHPIYRYSKPILLGVNL